MLNKIIFIVVSLFIFHLSASAHASWQQHAEDMYEVFGFAENEELTNWMRFVSSVLIDNNNSDTAFSKDGTSFDFYSHLQEKYPDFRCKHRLLFHWGYNSRPWTPYLQEKVESYGWSEEMIRNFQADLIAEQKRRNGFANEYTENVFGFAHGGKEARIARILISIAYDVHLLGDYEPDNTDLDGLQNIGAVVGDIINNLNALDKQQSRDLIKQLRKISQGQQYELQKKSSALLSLLKENFSSILQNAYEGRVAIHLNNQGFRFIDYNNLQANYEEVEPANKPFKNNKKRRKSSEKSTGAGYVIVFSLAFLCLLLLLLFKKK